MNVLEQPRKPGPKSLPITREPVEGGFVYRVNGRLLRRKSDLSRIESLAIPPAWKDVRIARSQSSKVLAAGIDDAGRTQCIYNPKFRRRQDRIKFDRMLKFAKALPKLRARVDRDLRRRGLTRDRVTACVVSLIDQQLFRVGNPAYAQAHESYGITTLHAKHLETGSTYVDYDFVGKSGKRQAGRVRDQRSVRIINQLMEFSGPEVFRYLDTDGDVRTLTSLDVNSYVKRHMGKSFSAKDFRTWGGTVAVVEALCEAPDDEVSSANERARTMRRAIDAAAQRLGNTPQVTRSSYVDPRVLAVVDRPKPLRAVRKRSFRSRNYFDLPEQQTLALLEAA